MSDRFELPRARSTGNLIHEGKKWPQRRDELLSFAGFVARKGVASYLEIGLWRGFTLRYIGGLLPKGSRIVGVDLQPDPDLARDVEQRLAELLALGYDAHLIVGDSTDPAIIAQAAALGPYDLVLIDGDHTIDGVRSDWQAYGPMGRMVAFHDIDRDHDPKYPMPADYGVPGLWRELQGSLRHRRIVGGRRGMGIGIVWR